jgi:SagB-type dehydrogenase family enzyme
MAIKSFAEYYHQETKYSPQGLSKNQKQLDWANQPSPFKEYKKGEKIELAAFISKKKTSKKSEMSPEDKNLEKLSKLLYYTNGITALVPYTTPLLLRASPSAGGLYPTEIYVVSNGYRGLKDGVYNFQVKTQSLIEFWDKSIWKKLKKSCFDHPSFDKAQLSVIFTGVFFRSSWRYEDRAYRRILLDTGHVIGNLITYAPFTGKYGTMIGGFADDEVNELLWLDKNEESVLAIVNLTDEKFSSDSSATLPSRLSTEEHNRNDLLLSFHNSGKISGSDNSKADFRPKEEPVSQNKFSFTFGELLNPEAINWQKKIEDVILNRRSTRAFNGDALTRDELGRLISFTYHPEMYESQGFDPNPNFFDLSLISTYIAVTEVDGLEDGCYYYSPAKKELRQIRFKNFREELCYLCLGQELGRDASVVFFHTVNLPAAARKYGERAYRYLHMDAGHLGQRLNLACMKVGLGVSGIGGFFDDQVNELLGIPETEAVLYITTVGRPFTNQDEALE